MRAAGLSIERGPIAQAELTALKQEIEALDGLDLELLRRRWRSLTGRSAPARLSRGLLLRMLAHQLQIARVGDLDRATRATLGEANHEPSRLAAKATDGNARVAASVALRPGTVLEREFGGVLHRVAVTKYGCSWNGGNFHSLSEAARAITGTRWNGPRFFGLRAEAKGSKASKQERDDASSAATACVTSTDGVR
jgi:hypothetical protein